MDLKKITAYIGFAKKAGKIVWGIDAITEKKRSYPLILIDNAASDRLKKDAEKYAGGNIPLVYLDGLSELCRSENVKAAAITDKELSRAILQNLGEVNQ
ncbi:MAG TPA: hypothetical protein P5161_06045 [Eubacteriales bacterium]|jgi:ribosomal protein L7Ae-like RNA K-turn-binding protein|nr:hypothetical protein [Clostridia bacterium]HRR90319.1 hypothetical protein [Eubacteriales bacterium]HRU84097.1 hypothetical protein [Eubacteriales bacterium]